MCARRTTEAAATPAPAPMDRSASLLSLGLLVVSVFFLHEQDDDSPENLHEVNEEVQRVFNEVSVSPFAFLNDHLGIPHYKATEKEQSTPKVDLENQLGLEKKV